MENRILVFAFNKANDCKFISPDSCYRGYFDGEKFVPREIGYCDSIEDLYNYDYIQLFGDNGAQHHIPKREYQFTNLLEEMRRSYIQVFGKKQISLFE